MEEFSGWFTTLRTARKRAVVSRTVLGGTVFFPTYVTTDGLCANSGNGLLNAFIYLPGSAYTESVIGTEDVGAHLREPVHRAEGHCVGLARGRPKNAPSVLFRRNLHKIAHASFDDHGNFICDIHSIY